MELRTIYDSPIPLSTSLYHVRKNGTVYSIKVAVNTGIRNERNTAAQNTYSLYTTPKLPNLKIEHVTVNLTTSETKSNANCPKTANHVDVINNKARKLAWVRAQGFPFLGNSSCGEREREKLSSQ